MSAARGHGGTADRRAALEMHGLSRQDRDWILGRLETDERRRIERLLGELDAMDIRFDLEPEWLAEGGASQSASRGTTAGAAPVPAAASGASSAATAVREANAADVIRVLKTEPPWLATAALEIENWPWRQPVRAALGEPAARVAGDRPGVANAAAGPALHAALVDLLAERLQAPAAAMANGAAKMNGRHLNGHAAMNGASGLGRFWAGVKQWLP